MRRSRSGSVRLPRRARTGHSEMRPATARRSDPTAAGTRPWERTRIFAWQSHSTCRSSRRTIRPARRAGGPRRARRSKLYSRPAITSTASRSIPLTTAASTFSRKANVLQLDRITLREIRLRLREPFRISSGVMDERRILLLELHDAGGTSEWAECVAGETPNYSPETIDTAWFAIREWLAPRLLGKSVGGPEAVHEILERNISGHNMAKAALEMGSYGVIARKREMSLSNLIGGQRDRVATGISIGIQKDPDALVERAKRALADGYRKIKLKIQPGADVEYVSAVRKALPESTDLMADANSAYRLEDADHLEKLDEFRLIMIEQPLNRDDL